MGLCWARSRLPSSVEPKVRGTQAGRLSAAHLRRRDEKGVISYKNTYSFYPPFGWAAGLLLWSSIYVGAPSWGARHVPRPIVNLENESSHIAVIGTDAIGCDKDYLRAAAKSESKANYTCGLDGSLRVRSDAVAGESAEYISRICAGVRPIFLRSISSSTTTLARPFNAASCSVGVPSRAHLPIKVPGASERGRRRFVFLGVSILAPMLFVRRLIIRSAGRKERTP